MKVNLIQGTPEWHAHRLTHHNASELAAAAGMSKYKSRSDMVREKATGIQEEITPETQKRFDKGHEIEAIARTFAEEYLDLDIGQSLDPCVFSEVIDGVPLSASLDGLNMPIMWECKTLNVELKTALSIGEIPEPYMLQMEQGMMLSGAERCLFTASNGTREGTIHAWYSSRPDIRALIIPTWKQLEEDVRNYKHVEVIPAAVAAPQISLPAVSIRVDGSIALVDNLGIFGDALTAYVQRINKTPETDQDFANLEATEKTLKRAEDELEAAVNSAIGQVVSIDTMKRTAEMYRNMARDNRLLVGKLVKARKDMIKAERIHSAVQILHDHILDLEDRLGGAWMPRIAGGFAEAIKGLKTLTSIDDAISVAMANAKVEANAVADLIERNHKSVEDWTLVPDFGAICQKAPEDFTAIIGMRKQQRAEADAKRLEAEREKIRAEEQAKAERDAQAKARSEQAKRDAEAANLRESERAKFEHERAKLQEEADKARNAEIHKAIINESAPAPADAQNAEPLVFNKIEANEPIDDEKERSLNFFNQDARKATEIPDDGKTLKLGEIASRLGFNVTADFLAQLGFQPHAIDKNAKLYRQADFNRICNALIDHINAAMRSAQMAA